MTEKLKKRSGPKAKKRAPAQKTATDRKLTARESAFVGFYVACNNGTMAAIKAGYSERSAGPQSSRLLIKANIQQEIEKIREKALKNEDLTPEKFVNHLKLIVFTNPLDFYDTWFSLKDLELVRHLGPILAGIDTKEDPETGERITRLRFKDTAKYQEMLKEFMPKQQENDNLEINFTL